MSDLGHNGIQVLKNVSQGEFLGFLQEYAEADATVLAATNARKDLRKRIEGKLGGKDEMIAFDRVRKDKEMSGEARTKRDLSHARMMAWLQMPVGFQPSMDLQSGDADTQAINVHLLKEVDQRGFEAGKDGRRRDTNPYNPGTEQAQRWDSAWLRGQAEIASTMGTGADNGERRGRGRPKGSTKAAIEARRAQAAEGEPGATQH